MCSVIQGDVLRSSIDEDMLCELTGQIEAGRNI